MLVNKIDIISSCHSAHVLQTYEDFLNPSVKTGSLKPNNNKNKQ